MGRNRQPYPIPEPGPGFRLGIRALRKTFPRRVQTFPPEEVTRVSSREVDPQDSGLVRDDVETIWRSVVAYYHMGLQPSIALCVRHRGQVILDRSIGHARGNGPQATSHTPREIATPDTLYNMFSASKAVTAMLIHLLDDRGLVHLDDAVCEYIPEFARHKKHWITIRHVLTHRAGIPVVPGEDIDLDMLVERERMLTAICDAKPASGAGRRLAYHAVTGGFILAEIILRVTGKNVRELLQEEVCDPLGFDRLNYGVPTSRIKDVAVESFTGPTPRFPYSRLLERALGVGMEEAVRIANDERFVTGIVPAGNVFGTANDVCRFFELLRCEGTLDGTRVFDRRTVRRAVSEQSYRELDTVMMLPVRYGMGFMLGGHHLSFYGHDTPRAFGHLGFTNIVAYADPEREISVALMNNGKPFIAPEQALWLRIPRVIARTIVRPR
jgi:CubicO group peptidase (beta-lactamase class C family)